MDPCVDPLPDGPPSPQVKGYSLGARLGVGGSAVVWAATRDSDGLQVAIKVLAVAEGEHSDAAVRELTVLGRVEVDGLVRLHEVVTLSGDEPRVALVLDHVGGGSLERVVRARGHLSVGESVTVLAPVARALAGLHAAGVVHGDVTPGNVLVELSGRPLLADLGVARFVGEAPGDALGTEGFVAPEVLDGGPLTPAADVYAAGALAWWCVTGQVPGPTSWRPPLESLAPGVPEGWRETTVRALSGDSAARPSAAEAALAWFDSAPCEPLRLVVGTDETSLLTHRLRRPPVEVEEPTPTTRRERIAQLAGASRGAVRARGPRVTAALAGAGLVAVLVLGACMAGGLLPAPRWLTAPAAAEPTASASPAGTPAPAGSASTASVQGRRGAPRDSPSALVQELATRRAAAMLSRRTSDLGALDAPGSPALTRDTADLERVRGAGVAYAGVRLTVRSARTVTATQRTATIDAVVDTAAYRVVSATDGRLLRTEDEVRGQGLRFDLVWIGGRWLIEQVEPAGR